MLNRKEAKLGMNLVKYGMSYSPIGSGSFTGHEAFIDKLYDSFEEELNDLKTRSCETCIHCQYKGHGLGECISDDSFFFNMELPLTTLCETYERRKG